jgi:hypothetical protein
MFHVTPQETEGRFVCSIGNHAWDIPALRELLEEIVPQNTHFNGFEVDHEFPAIGRRTMLLNARRIYREGKGRIGYSSLLRTSPTKSRRRRPVTKEPD